MGLFDLLFLALFFAAAAMAMAAVWSLVKRDMARARRIAARLVAGAAVYMSAVILVSAISPRRTHAAGSTRCFDDWCIAVAGVKRAPEGDLVRYTIDLRLSSRARRVSQRENNLAVYLTDSRDRLYRAIPDPSAIPFHVLLRPGESVLATRSFLAPPAASDVGLVVAHEGGFPIGWLILGYDTWFRKPAILQLP